MFKPKSKKKQRRTLYFAIVVFKSEDSVDRLINDTKFLQGKINRLAKKQVGFMSNPFLENATDLMRDGADSDESESDIHRQQQKALMEEGGFTLVQEEPDNAGRMRGRD